MKFISLSSKIKFLASVCCTSALLLSNAYADNFVQVHPKPQHKIQPPTKIDRTIQKEIQKHPKNTALIIDARTGKILSTVPLKNFNTKKSPKIIPQKTPPKNNKILPYKMKEEHLELL